MQPNSELGLPQYGPQIDSAWALLSFSRKKNVWLVLKQTKRKPTLGVPDLDKPSLALPGCDYLGPV